MDIAKNITHTCHQSYTRTGLWLYGKKSIVLWCPTISNHGWLSHAWNTTAHSTVQVNKCHHTVYCETPLLRTPWNKDTSVLKLSQTMVYNINSPLKRGHPFNRAYICPNGVLNREISLYMKIVHMQYITVLSLHTIVDYSLSQLYYITLFVL